MSKLFNKALLWAALCIAIQTASHPDAMSQPVSDSDFIYMVPASVGFHPTPTVDTAYNYAVWIKNKTVLGAIALPICYQGSPALSLDYTVLTAPDIRGVTYGPAGRKSGWTIKTTLIDSLNKSILCAFISFASFPQSNDTLLYLHFKLKANAPPTTVTCDTCLAGGQRVAITDVLAQDQKPTWTRGQIEIQTFPEPYLSVSPPVVAISQTYGTGNPSPQALALINYGTDTLRWTASVTQAWLAVAPESGVGNDTLTVGFDIAGLAPDTHIAYVVVVDTGAANSPESVKVTLVLNKPTLFSGPSHLQFSGQAGSLSLGSQQLTITASQSAAVSWTASSLSGLVSIATTQGLTPFGIAIDVNAAFLEEGIHRDTVRLVSLNATNEVRVPVTITLTGNVNRPTIENLKIGFPQDPNHITSQSPILTWHYSDPKERPQARFEIQCGTDNDWNFAEVWSTGMLVGNDTSIAYQGSTLIDGRTYFSRARVFNDTLWSTWATNSFRMNSKPTVPSPQSPVAGTVVLTLSPTLTIVNSSDAEGDNIHYSFQVHGDSLYTNLLADAFGIVSGPGRTSWTSDPLPDNTKVWWRVRGSDGYENSSWSVGSSVWIDGIADPPLPSVLVAPPNGTEVLSERVLLVWNKSIDPDPVDTLRYRIQVAIDTGFVFVATFEDIHDTMFTVPSELITGLNYYWRVITFDQRSADSAVSSRFRFVQSLPGDINNDGNISSADIIALVNYVFKAGAAPSPLAKGDVNASCAVSSADIVYLVNVVFKGGPAPLPGCA